MKNLLSFLFLASIVMVFSCSKDDDSGDDGGSTCDTSNITYTNTVKAILDASCAVAGCHSETEAAEARGSMHDYASAKVFGTGDRLKGSINHQVDFSPMPFPAGTDKLAACDIDKIEAWITDGAPE